MFLFCCEGSNEKAPEYGGECFEEEIGGADVPPSPKQAFPGPAFCKRESESSEVIEESVNDAFWAEDSGSVSCESFPEDGGSKCEDKESASTAEQPQSDEDNDDEWTPEVIAFYYKVLSAVGKALKKSLSKKKVDTAWCITQPSCIKNYVRGLIYTEATAECFIIAVIFLERYLVRNPRTPLTANNIQLFYLTALTVAIKYVDDSYFNSEYYAKIGGVADVRTLNRLEMKFLFGLNFDLMVNDDEFRETEIALLGTQLQTKRRRTNSRQSRPLE